MKFIQEFKEFAIKGNAIELAVGIVVGAAFTSIVNSLVNDMINPVIGVLTGRVDFTKLTVDLPGESILRYGAFIGAIINFLLISLTVFLLVKQINRFRRNNETAPSEKQCPYCASAIPVRAVKCPHCTSSI